MTRLKSSAEFVNKTTKRITIFSLILDLTKNFFDRFFSLVLFVAIIKKKEKSWFVISKIF